MNREKLKRYSKFFIKLILTSAALFFVFTKIDFQEFIKTISTIKVHYFLLAVVAYNLSKMISAFRINHFYEAMGIRLPINFNLKLYYVGMFYNLFLPGAIGGDGYKVYLLKTQVKSTNTKHLISATILDRISGLIILFLLACVGILFSNYQSTFKYFQEITIIIIITVLPVSYFIIKKIFPVFISKFWITSLLSLGVQVAQVISAIFILLSISIFINHVDYLSLFLVSSVVAVLPFTIGGVGARELVFLYGYNYLNIDRPAAIAFTLLFFFATAITSLIGLFFSYRIDQEKLTINAKG